MSFKRRRWITKNACTNPTMWQIQNAPWGCVTWSDFTYQPLRERERKKNLHRKDKNVNLRWYLKIQSDTFTVLLSAGSAPEDKVRRYQRSAQVWLMGRSGELIRSSDFQPTLGTWPTFACDWVKVRHVTIFFFFGGGNISRRHTNPSKQ